MRQLNFTIIKLTFFLIIGILIGYYFNVNLYKSILVSSILLLGLIILYVVTKRWFNKPILFGVVAYLTMLAIGTLTVNLHNEINFKNHYTNFIKKDSTSIITLRIHKVLKPDLFNDKYLVDILKVDNNKIKGISILNITKDSLLKQYEVDDILFTSAVFKEIGSIKNPGQFDYKNYLKKQYVCHQIYSSNESLFSIQKSKHTIFGFAASLRQKINSKLKAYHLEKDKLAIINALLLGQRQDINPDTYNDYANAGVIHILAVSGLHVGIILLLLSFLLKPLEHARHGKTIKLIVLVALLWAFAIVAGLSASVTRAVTMFSIVAIGLNIKRPTNIYNTIAISMFVLLLFKPLFLFDVGFQLSYLAVFAIVWIQPLLYKKWKPKYKVMDFFWSIFTVTIAAQLGIFPLSLFYFHQFPGLFFVSNLVIIPFLGIILGFGLIVMILALANILPSFIIEAYGNIIGLMNSFVAWIAQQEQFLFKNISFNYAQLIALYFLIGALIIFLKQRTTLKLKFLLSAIILLQLSFIYTSYSNSSNTFTIFHKSRYTLLANKQDNTILISHNLDSLSNTKNKTLVNYSVKEHIKSSTEVDLKNVYSINNEFILVIDSLGVYKNLSFNPDYILLRNSPKINLNRVIDSLSPKIIIADGSNYKSYVNRWKVTCEHKKLPFHNTNEKGAFVIEYSKNLTNNN